MLDKRALVFRIIIGIALVYIGGDLFVSVLRERPENYLMFAAAGAVFALIGIGWAALAYKKIAAHEYKEESENDQDMIREENEDEKEGEE